MTEFDFTNTFRNANDNGIDAPLTRRRIFLSGHALEAVLMMSAIHCNSCLLAIKFKSSNRVQPSLLSPSDLSSLLHSLFALPLRTLIYIFDNRRCLCHLAIYFQSLPGSQLSYQLFFVGY